MYDAEVIRTCEKYLDHQMNVWWPEYNWDSIRRHIKPALDLMESNFSVLKSPRVRNANGMIFNPLYSLSWMIFLYRISVLLYKAGEVTEADRIYYLNKIMHGIDWFYQVELPIHFMAEHPLGSVLGKAQYGDYLFIYQGTTIGGNRKGEALYYPVLGNNVIMYANSTIIGKSVIGNNVVVAADTYIIDDIVPDNSIVFGKSPNLIVKQKDESKIKDLTAHIWSW